jgi:hypothetical protein
MVPGFAAPLTIYEFGEVSIDAGITAPQISATYEDGSGALLSPYWSNYGVAYSATIGLGKPFALRIHGDEPLFGNAQNQNCRYSDQNIEFLWGFHLTQPTFLVLYTGFGDYQLGGSRQAVDVFSLLKFGLMLDYEYLDSASLYADFSWSGSATTITAGGDYKLAERFVAGISMNGVVLHNGVAKTGPLSNCYNISVWYPELSVTYKF